MPEHTARRCTLCAGTYRTAVGPTARRCTLHHCAHSTPALIALVPIVHVGAHRTPASVVRQYIFRTLAYTLGNTAPQQIPCAGGLQKSEHTLAHFTCNGICRHPLHAGRFCLQAHALARSAWGRICRRTSSACACWAPALIVYQRLLRACAYYFAHRTRSTLTLRVPRVHGLHIARGLQTPRRHRVRIGCTPRAHRAHRVLHVSTFQIKKFHYNF